MRCDDLTCIVVIPEYDRQFRVGSPGASLGELLRQALAQGLARGPVAPGGVQKLYARVSLLFLPYIVFIV